VQFALAFQVADEALLLLQQLAAQAAGERHDLRLRIVVAQHQRGTSSVISASSALRCLSVISPSAMTRPSRILMFTSWSEVSTPAELSIASV
jgi:hypothetical protein